MFSDDITKKIAAAAAQIKTEPPKNEVNTKSVEGAVVSIMANEELKGNQHKIDANKNGKIDAHDFKLLRGKKDMKKEEVEQLDEVGDTPAGRKALGSYVSKAIADKSKDRTKGLRKATSRMYKDDYYGKKTNEEVELDEAKKPMSKDEKDKVVGAVQAAMRKSYGNVIAGRAQLAAARLAAKIKAGKKTNEEVEQVDEAFPTVADAKKRMDAKESPFEKKKISTGTVYSRKYKEEPDEDLKSPSRRARDSAAVLGKGEHMAKKKKMSEMLDLYINHGVESLVENLMIEEPSQNEYKQEVETAQAKSEGKIRNDKEIAKAASQGVRMEEVENIGEASTYKLGRAAAETKDFPIHHNGEHVGKLEFHTSAGKLHHRVSSIKGVPHEKFIGHPDREKMTNAHVAKHEAEARKHFAKKLKEEVEIEMYDADEINNVQINNIDERSLTSAEMNKREEIVKSMKKGIQGFKDRYGERAKEVMYATATARAKGD